MTKKQREYTTFTVDGLRVYAVTIHYRGIDQKEVKLVSANSPSEAVRIMQAERKQFREYPADYDFKAERACVLKPVSE